MKHLVFASPYNLFLLVVDDKYWVFIGSCWYLEQIVYGSYIYTLRLHNIESFG